MEKPSLSFWNPQYSWTRAQLCLYCFGMPRVAWSWEQRAGSSTKGSLSARTTACVTSPNASTCLGCTPVTSLLSNATLGIGNVDVMDQSVSTGRLSYYCVCDTASALVSATVWGWDLSGFTDGDSWPQRTDGGMTCGALWVMWDVPERRPRLRAVLFAASTSHLRLIFDSSYNLTDRR